MAAKPERRMAAINCGLGASIHSLYRLRCKPMRPSAVMVWVEDLMTRMCLLSTDQFEIPASIGRQ